MESRPALHRSLYSSLYRSSGIPLRTPTPVTTKTSPTPPSSDNTYRKKNGRTVKLYTDPNTERRYYMTRSKTTGQRIKVYLKV